MKVTVYPASIRGQRKWAVYWKPPGGKRVRHFHDTKTMAIAEQQEVTARFNHSGHAFSALSGDERNALIALHHEARERGYALREAADFFWSHQDLVKASLTELRGVLHDAEAAGCTLRQALTFFLANREVARNSCTAGQAYSDWLTELERHKVSGRAMKAYRSNVGRFLDPHKAREVSSLKRDEVLAWLQQWKDVTYNTYLTSLHSFFIWCERTRRITSAPTRSIDKIRRERLEAFDRPPIILSLLQCARLLKTTLALDPGLLHIPACGLFGGLRPESESERLLKDHLQSDDTIWVRGRHAKDRRQRYVPMVHHLGTETISTLKSWLALGADYSRIINDHIVRPKNFRRRWERIREAAGLITRVKVKGRDRLQIVDTGWSQDCLRHTFASHYLALFGAESTASILGHHGDYSMLFSHYRALVKDSEARAFWKLTPDFIRRGNFSSLTPAHNKSEKPGML